MLNYIKKIDKKVNIYYIQKLILRKKFKIYILFIFI
jgi:hypothetical protein